ncbi:MAG TPA: prolyl oligopeptidase family serine peptidase, partial [Candidatus Sulfotelmatobacter sp.]|nr:prolyl oligopeptidase family serine peptidase [Candidatus Sulfotelmatobacter sp.]
MRRLLLSFLVLAFTLPALAQAKHPFTFEDMMKLKRVGDPQVSPDGRWVIFSVVDVDLEMNTKTPHIWIVPLNANAGTAHVGKAGVGTDRVGTGAPPVQAERSSAGSSSSEREIIADQDADRPRWAPDGKHFAFLSTKEAGSQVWIAEFNDLDGLVTGVHKLTSITTEANGELWSPDGKNILFTSDVYPECDGAPEAETSCNAKKLKEVEQSKVKALIFDHLLYRHWNAYKEGKRSHIFVISRLMEPIVHDPNAPPVDTVPRDLTPGDYDAPVFSLGGQDDYSFSPDGKEICYTSNHDKNPAASTNNDLWIVPVNVGADAFVRPASGASGVEGPAQAQHWVKTVLAQTKNITADNPASDSSPLYSPDGRYIAYRAQQRPGYESDEFRLMAYDRSSSKSRELFTATTSDWVGTFIWAPDSRRIFYVSNHQEGAGEGQMNVVWSTTVEPVAVNPKPFVQSLPEDVRKGLQPITKLIMAEAWARGYADDLAFSPDGKTLFFTRMSLQRPNEIWQLILPPKIEWDNLPRGEPLTHFNDAVLSEISMSPLQTFWFTGAHDDKVEGFLIKPPNFDVSKKYPVKFLIHGGPQGAWGDDWSYRWNPELFAAPTSSTSGGYVVVMINFHGSTGYGQKFIDAINGDWGGAPYEDLMKGLDYAEEHYPFIDKTRECALGASY